MTSSNGSIFGVTGPLCWEVPGHRWISRTKASDVELWCFLWSALWINAGVNNRDAHYDVIVMYFPCRINLLWLEYSARLGRYCGCWCPGDTRSQATAPMLLRMWYTRQTSSLIYTSNYPGKLNVLEDEVHLYISSNCISIFPQYNLALVAYIHRFRWDVVII